MAVAHQFEDRPVSIRVGDFELRVAESPGEIEQAQALRYRIFYEEMGAQPTAEMAAKRRDFDSFDSVCDHLLIIDHKHGGSGKVIGTYRILRRSVAQKHGRFYTSDEFDIAPLLAHPGEIMELGRSCIEAEYRSRAAMQLMWRGITDYVMHYRSAWLRQRPASSRKPMRLSISITIIWRRSSCAPRSARPHGAHEPVEPGRIDKKAAMKMPP
jgi:putative hemolysin